MFKCINTSNQVRTFPSYEEAHRFVMREGDQSRLWSLEKVSPDRKSIDGFDIYEVFEIHTGEVVAELDHEVLAAWKATDLTEDNASLGYVYASRIAA